MPSEPTSRKRSRLRLWQRRWRRTVARIDVFPKLEIATGFLALTIGIVTYAIIASNSGASFSPLGITLMLVVNLAPLMVLLTLLARRLAIRLVHRRQGRTGTRLHVRLLAFFSLVAAVPTLLVVIFASLLFQTGVQFWASDRARTILVNSERVAQAYVEENKQRITADLLAMAGDVNGYGRDYGADSPQFAEGLAWQVAARNLSEAAVVGRDPKGNLQLISAANLDARPLSQRIRAADLNAVGAGAAHVVAGASDRVEALVRLAPDEEIYLYASRLVAPEVLAQVAQTKTALNDYRSLIDRSQALQLRFNLTLLGGSLLILAAAVWLALWLARRLVQPMGPLISAAEKVGAGDLTARVPLRGSPDEFSTLARAFNRMTGQLRTQTNQLMQANSQLESRRSFMEAVLSGVTAGVLSVDAEQVVQLINTSAEELLETEGRNPIGCPLALVAPELGRMLEAGESEAVIETVSTAEPRTLAVKIVRSDGGHVLTFDDITQQVHDQRRAAWSDVARRIAHEIKNPLTPIQLSAERLQRKYGASIADDPATFQRLTGTIVRQVGDLRRMVDEFSDFARMPKPSFRPEPLLDIVRQALFLHEVGHPRIHFRLEAPDSLPILVCDRRQIGQALTNLIKNAAEAVETRQERDGTDEGTVAVTIQVRDHHLRIGIGDDGIGLPLDRARLTEPYVTTRTRGTGLGLAIVKKIVEEHLGVLTFSDREGGGTTVHIEFDMAALAALAERQGEDSGPSSVGQGG